MRPCLRRPAPLFTLGLLWSLSLAAPACGGKVDGGGTSGGGSSGSGSGGSGSGGSGGGGSSSGGASSGGSSSGASSSGSSSGTTSTCPVQPGQGSCTSGEQCSYGSGCSSIDCWCDGSGNWACAGTACPVQACPVDMPVPGTACYGTGMPCMYADDAGCGITQCDCGSSGNWECLYGACVDAGAPQDAGWTD